MADVVHTLTQRDEAYLVKVSNYDSRLKNVTWEFTQIQPL